MPGGGRVDVSIETMNMILNRRSDIRDMYCANLRPNGLPWCPVVNGMPQPDVVGIITDWWTRNAGASDDPSLYGYSLAKFVEQQFGIPGVAQPGDPVSGINASQGLQSLSGSSRLEFFWITGIGIFVTTMFLWGSTRKQKLIYQETGGTGGRVSTPRRR